MSPAYAFAAPRLLGDAGSFSFLYTADAGVGAVPVDEQGGATHNDPPANGADEVYAAMLRDPLTAKEEFMFVNGGISVCWEGGVALAVSLVRALAGASALALPACSTTR
jgi:hypothetical protein